MQIFIIIHGCDDLLCYTTVLDYQLKNFQKKKKSDSVRARWDIGVGGINDVNHDYQLLRQLSIQNIWASIQNVWCAQHSAQLSYILYGDFFNSEGSHMKYMGLRSLIHFVWGFLSYILYGDFSHTFCMGIASTLGAHYQLR